MGFLKDAAKIFFTEASVGLGPVQQPQTTAVEQAKLGLQRDTGLLGTLGIIAELNQPLQPIQERQSATSLLLGKVLQEAGAKEAVTFIAGTLLETFGGVNGPVRPAVPNEHTAFKRVVGAPVAAFQLGRSLIKSHKEKQAKAAAINAQNAAEEKMKNMRQQALSWTKEMGDAEKARAQYAGARAHYETQAAQASIVAAAGLGKMSDIYESFRQASQATYGRGDATPGSADGSANHRPAPSGDGNVVDGEAK